MIIRKKPLDEWHWLGFNLLWCHMMLRASCHIHYWQSISTWYHSRIVPLGIPITTSSNNRLNWGFFPPLSADADEKGKKRERENLLLCFCCVVHTHNSISSLERKIDFFFGRPSGMNEKIRFTFLGRMIGIHPNLFPFSARLQTLLISLIYILAWVIKFVKLQTTTECSTRPNFNGKTEISLGGNARSI